MIQERFGQRNARKALAILGAVTVGATLFVGITQTSTAEAAVKKGCVNHLAKKDYPAKDIKKGDRIYYVYVTDPKTKKKQLDPRKCTDEDVRVATKKIAQRPDLGEEQTKLRGADGLNDVDAAGKDAGIDGGEPIAPDCKVWLDGSSDSPRPASCGPLTAAATGAAVPSDAKYKQKIAYDLYQWMLKNKPSTIANSAGVCSPGYTRDSSKDASQSEGTKYQEGRISSGQKRCNLVNWGDFLAGVKAQTLSQLTDSYHKTTGMNPGAG